MKDDCQTGITILHFNFCLLPFAFQVS